MLIGEPKTPHVHDFWILEPVISSQSQLFYLWIHQDTKTIQGNSRKGIGNQNALGHGRSDGLEYFAWNDEAESSLMQMHMSQAYNSMSKTARAWYQKRKRKNMAVPEKWQNAQQRLSQMRRRKK